MATNPFLNGGNYGWGGSGAYDTPFVKDYLSQETPQGEYETYLTGQGYGGFNRQDQFARGLSSRANAGYQGAILQNPMLTYRDYLNQNLGSNFFTNAWNAATPDQRGESPNRFAGRARTIGRA